MTNPRQKPGLLRLRDEMRQHLDSILFGHHDAILRTTVTLDKDVERMLRNAMHRSRKSFKQTLNTALRMGLGAKPSSAKAKRFVVKARPLGLRAGIDPASFNRLADDLEVDEFLEQHKRARRS